MTTPSQPAPGSPPKSDPPADKDALAAAAGDQRAPPDALAAARAGEKTEAPADEKKAESTADKKKTEAPADEKKEAPKLELKVPEGAQLDEKHLSRFREFAEKNGLDAAKAQGALDLYLEIEQGRVAAGEEQLKAQSAKWAEALQKDPDLGGAKWKDTVRDMNRAINHFKADELVETLRSMGLGNLPAAARFFAQVGRSLREDSVSGSNGAKSAGGAKPLGDVLYGDGPMGRRPSTQ